MSKIKSITRFPGGKSRSLKFLNEFLELPYDFYREPFIGGCTVFLGKNKAKNNWINDLDYEIYAMHITIRDNPDKMIEYIKEYTQPTLESYNQILNDNRDDIIWRGFRCLFLNRCSFNGMTFGGPIGGRNQTGKWLVDCCWKKEILIERVKSIHEKLRDVKITNLDFEELIKEPGENVFLYLDPPYYHEGNKLYAVGMSLNDHERLRNLLLETPHDFLLSYRDCAEVRELYKNKDKFVILERTWTYSMMTQSKKGCQQSNEVFIMNHNLYNKYLNKKEQEKTEQQKIKKITLVRTINNEDGVPEGEGIHIGTEYKNFYKGTWNSPIEQEKVKIKKKNCKIVEYEQYGEIINLEKGSNNIDLWI